MKEVGVGTIAFLLGVVATLYFVTADRASWSLQAESSAPALRGTTAEDVVTHTLELSSVAAQCVSCCIPVKSGDGEQKPCLKARVYDEETALWRYLRPSDVFKE